MKIWGVSVSYYTGKLEAYLRYKGIAYDMEHPFAKQKYIRERAGAIQVPIVERPDGRWMSDSTPIIQQLESEYPDRSIMPSDPVVRFIALLVEDYGDEWLWRSAMHYRWSYEHDRELLSRVLADELTNHLPLPRFIRRHMVKHRQHTRFVARDGVTRDTWDHVEAGFFNAMRGMLSMLKNRPYLLGDTPSVADIGMMGPMLRHFGQDPTPAAIMRNEWPAMAEWVARVWNAHSTAGETSLLDVIPDDAAPLLKEIAETHLVQLKENALAYGAGQKQFEMTVQGCAYKELPVSRYRVYCLERLREEFANLSKGNQQKVKSVLPQEEYTLIWDPTVKANSGYDVERAAPFNKGINVLETG